jgi:hypothetical protein
VEFTSHTAHRMKSSMTKGEKPNSRKQLLNSCLDCNEEKIKNANLDTHVQPGSRKFLRGPSLTILLHS